MNIDENVLYAWDSENKQVLTIPKIKFETNCILNTNTTKRMFVIDTNYSTNNSSINHTPFRYGSYLFTKDNHLIGFWEPKKLSDFPLEFRTNLLLMGIE